MKREITLVLGMHRSGTSLCTGIIHALGGELGNDLICGDRHNPAGYFEDKDIVALQESFHAEKAPWISLEATLPAPWERKTLLASRTDRLMALLQSERYKRHSHLVVKDPRSAHFLDVWQLAGERLDIALRFVLCIRNPREVVDSLVRRDHIPPQRAALIWVQHYVELFRLADRHVTLVVEYSDWFREERAILVARRLVCELGLASPVDSQTLRRLLAGMIDPALYHCRRQGMKDDNRVLATLYHLLQTADKPDGLARLKQFVAHYDAMEYLFSEWADRALAGAGAGCRLESEQPDSGQDPAALGGQECQALRRELDALRRSLSWRLTRPFRKVRCLVREYAPRCQG